jgi:hypothetical protein
MRIITAVILAAAFSASALAGDSEWERGSLKGIKAVGVLIDLSSDAGVCGVNSSILLTDVELKLRLAGINVLSAEEHKKDALKPFVYVAADVMKDRHTKACVWHVTVALSQVVSLHRDQSITTAASTWDAGMLGIEFPTAEQGVRDAAKNLVDQFLNAYLSVNPKQ